MKRIFRTRWTPGLLVAGIALGGVAADGVAGEGGGRSRLAPREQARIDGATSSVTLYGALLRTDAPPRVALRLPAPRWGVDRLRTTLEAGVPVRLDLTR